MWRSDIVNLEDFHILPVKVSSEADNIIIILKIVVPDKIQIIIF